MRARRPRLAIQLLRLLELSVEVQQSPEIDPRLEVIFLDAQRREVRGTGGIDVRVLEQVPALKVLVRDLGRRHRPS